MDLVGKLKAAVSEATRRRAGIWRGLAWPCHLEPLAAPR